MGGRASRARSARTRGVAAGRSAQRACERSSDWRRGAAGSPDPDSLPCAGSPDPPHRRGQHVRGGSPRKGARSELASVAATGGGGPQAPPTRLSLGAGPQVPPTRTLIEVETIPGDVVPLGAIPGDVVPGDVVPTCLIPGDVVPLGGIPGNVVPGDVVPRRVVPRQRRPGVGTPIGAEVG